MRKAFWQLHLAVFLAGFTGILGRLIDLNEAMIVWWRLLISSATMWVLFSITKSLQPVPAKDRWRILGVGVIASTHWVCFYGSIKYANVSVGLVCFSAVGFFTALLEPLLLRTRFRPVELLLGLMVMAGIYIIFHFDTRYTKGILFGVFSSMLGAIFPVFNRRLMQRMNAETLMTWELSGGLLALTVMLPFYFKATGPVQYWPGTEDWLWLLFLSWICSVWAFRLSANALRKISAFTVNLTYNLEPVYGIALAFLVYHENRELNGGFYAGFAVILAAVLLQTRRATRVLGS